MLRAIATTTATLLGAGAVAHANPASFVPSIGDANSVGDVHLEYQFEYDSALITREAVGEPGTDPSAPIPRHGDLQSKQYTHSLLASTDLAVYHDTWLTIGIPIVIANARELSLASGVTRDTSSTLRDGYLPPAGYDARDAGTPPGGDLVFKGANRRGVGQVRVGLGVAPMNQAHDDTKPTWKLGAEVRFAVGKVARFDMMNPTNETGVSTGVHELRLWTSVDKRFSWAEGWFEAHWQAPIANRDSSLYKDPGFGSTNTDEGQIGGASFGLEAYALDDKANENRISFDLGARIDAHFEGRGYSELWEVFAYAGDARANGPLVLDADPTAEGLQALSHPGITNIENYLETGARLAIRAKLGAHVRFSLAGELIWKTDHAITFADAGVDLPTCKGAAAPNCEVSNNDLVNPGTREVNPLHNAQIDLVGHRYRSEENLGIVFGVESQITF